ncbi:MAG TPA: hypothetical protein VI300_25420, partial [Solirubrobacter sp.]
SEAIAQAEIAGDPFGTMYSLSFRAIAAHFLGNVTSARSDFAAAIEIEGGPLVSLRGAHHVRHRLDLRELVDARAIANHGADAARTYGWIDSLPRLNAVLARIDLAEAADPAPHVDEIREWTSRTGDMELIVEAHLLAARRQLAAGDLQAALGEVESGLLHAVACGFGLLRIELLIALARIRLAWPDPPAAIQAAREALDLAADPECQYAWGEADAAQAWGEAYFSNHEFDLARRAFERALEVRRRIEHPGVAETGTWLDRLA